MDPYLEQFWGDIHQRLVLYACDQVQEQLPETLRARVEERVFVQAEDRVERTVYPDVKVTERPGRPSASEGGVAVAEGVAVEEPLVVHYEPEPVTESFLEIIEAGTGHRVITVLEVLSLTNKTPGEGRELYHRKQRELRQGGVSLVEVDLLRAGGYILALPFAQMPDSCRTTYRVCVRRAWRPGTYEVYPVPLRRRLPSIRVPLRERDPDVRLDLQALIEKAYRNGRYDDIDYRRPPAPPLEEGDAQWTDELLRSKGLRP
jgi:hypothetical protein